MLAMGLGEHLIIWVGCELHPLRTGQRAQSVTLHLLAAVLEEVPEVLTSSAKWECSGFLLWL